MKKLLYIFPFLLITVITTLAGCSDSAQNAKAEETIATPTEGIAEKTATKPEIPKEPASSEKKLSATDKTEDAIELTWNMLKDVTFEEKYYENIKQYLLYPTFGQSLKDLVGKTVYITGYVIPVEAERYVLSANPFASCFFCGNAGPETIVELELTTYDQMYYTDEWRTFKGRFQLNAEDIDKLNYLLVEAEPLDE